MFTIRNVGILLLAALVFASCNSYEKSKRIRAEKIAASKGPIVIAIVWPNDNINLPFINGMSLAIDEINRAEGVMGKKLQTVMYDEPTGKNGYKIAKQVIKNQNIVAVVGHSNSASAIPASITYEENGILFLAPSSSSPALTAHDFQYVFRTAPSDVMIGRHMAQFTHRKGYRRIIILDDNSIYGTGLADIYYAAAVDLGLEIVSHKAYFKWQSDYRPLISEFTKLDFDAVFLAGLMPNGALMIKQFREMGIHAPFISGDGLDFPDLPVIAGSAAEGTVVPTVFNPDADNQLVREFKNSFEKRFNSTPGTWDALGYDAIKLLAFAFEKSGSTVPIIVSSMLRFTKHWQGVTGDYTFDINGELSEKPLYFKKVRNGRFEFIKE